MAERYDNPLPVPANPVSFVEKYPRIAVDLEWQQKFVESKEFSTKDPISAIDCAFSFDSTKISLVAAHESSVQLYGADLSANGQIQQIRSLKQPGTPPMNSVRFRFDTQNDVQLVGTAANDGYIRVFRSSTGTCLRLFGRKKKNAQKAFSSCLFTPCNRVVGGSNQGDLVFFELAHDRDPGLKLTSAAHNDAVRSLAYWCGQSILISGSLDHSVKLTDLKSHELIRNLEAEEPVMCVNACGSNHLLAASGRKVLVWDLRNTSSVFAELDSHRKVVMSAQSDEDGKLVFAGGLDGYVKIYDLQRPNFPVVQSVDFKSPICSIKYSLNVLTAGQTNGRLCLRYPTTKRCLTSATTQMSSDKRSKLKRSRANKTHFRLFREFCVSESLDAALELYAHSQITADEVVGLLREMWKNDFLDRALAGRYDKHTLGPIVRFVCEHFHNPKFVDILLDVTESLVKTLRALSDEDIKNLEFGTQANSVVDQMLVELKSQVERETKICENANSLAKLCEKLIYDEDQEPN